MCQEMQLHRTTKKQIRRQPIFWNCIKPKSTKYYNNFEDTMKKELNQPIQLHVICLFKLEAHPCLSHIYHNSFMLGCCYLFPCLLSIHFFKHGRATPFHFLYVTILCITNLKVVGKYSWAF